MNHQLPSGWHELKQELLSRWHEINENDLYRTRDERTSIIELLEKKVGMRFDEASLYFEGLASRFHLYDEPKFTKMPLDKDKKESTKEMTPQSPSNLDQKPKDDFHIG